MMLQAMETTVMDSYTEFTAEDMPNIHNLWFYRMFNQMENTYILLSGLTTNIEGTIRYNVTII